MTKIEQCGECPICGEGYNDEKIRKLVLRCGYDLCFECAKKRDVTSEHSNNPPLYDCPECRKQLMDFRIENYK